MRTRARTWNGSWRGAPAGTRAVRRAAGAAVLAAVLGLASAGCSSGGARSGSGAAEPSADTAAAQARAAAPAGKGELVVSFTEGLTAADRETEAFLRKNKALEDIAAYVNRRVALPYNVPVEAKSCGTTDAYWDPTARAITYCYEFLGRVEPAFGTPPGPGLVGLTQGVVVHALGHGLIAMNGLSSDGDEEEAVDQLSATLLTTGDDDKRLVSGIVDGWAVMARQDARSDARTAFADDHAVDEKRFHAWACWVYGSDPEGYADLIAPDVLPEKRSKGCEQAYKEVAKTWGKALEPYLK
ncbi:hypothetical protein F0344_20965 [Streptomyces finlayi]|uniref:Metallopeptidase n=1 Tax=Streptomyces finlayi TaxID=67296 RepID=A0A7G7BN50_9ACTN|nr:DUF4344 domain-containing metallopeptidase [Streptomyces finlayi]QNE76765.1 hypothetical protein F0344_20965 [Streptomyces finlayi]